MPNYALKKNQTIIAGIFFTLLAVLPAFLFLSTSVHKWQIKKQFAGRIESSRKLATVIVKESDVVWMDKHEIYIHEKMFDIKTSTLIDGVYTFKGYYDSDETSLIKNQHQTTKQSNTSTQNWLLKYLQLFNAIKYDDTTLSASSTIVHSLKLITIRKDVYIAIKTPPPQA